MVECEFLCCWKEMRRSGHLPMSMCAASPVWCTLNPENKLQPLETDVTSLDCSSSSGGEHTQPKEPPQSLYSKGKYGFGED